MLLLCLIAITACSSKKSRIAVDVKEIDFINNSESILKGKPINIQVLGANNMIIKDSIIAFTTNDQNGMLQVFNLKTMDQIGKFCTKGRAKNEFLQAWLINSTIKKNGDIILPLTNYPNEELKMVNLSKSLQRGSTVVDEVTDCFRGGSFVILGNSTEKRFEYHIQEEPNKKHRGIPVHYVIRNGDKEKTINIFSKPLKYEQKDDDYIEPFECGLYKHPEKNIVLQNFISLDYIFLFDIDKRHYYAIHQIGSPSFDDAYQHQDDDGITFGNVAVANEFFIVLYWNGNYSNSYDDNQKKPEAIMFDWDGNYIKGVMLDQIVHVIEYDSKEKMLYGLNRDNDSVYCFDLK